MPSKFKAAAIGLAGILASGTSIAQNTSLESQISAPAIVQEFKNPLQEYLDFMAEFWKVHPKQYAEPKRSITQKFDSGRINMSYDDSASLTSVSVDAGDVRYRLSQPKNNGEYMFSVDRFTSEKRLSGYKTLYSKNFTVNQNYTVSDCTVTTTQVGGFEAVGFGTYCQLKEFKTMTPDEKLNEQLEFNREFGNFFNALKGGFH